MFIFIKFSHFIYNKRDTKVIHHCHITCAARNACETANHRETKQSRLQKFSGCVLFWFSEIRIKPNVQFTGRRRIRDGNISLHIHRGRDNSLLSPDDSRYHRRRNDFLQISSLHWSIIAFRIPESNISFPFLFSLLITVLVRTVV